MKRLLGPFSVIVFLASITLCAAFGLYTLVTLHAWWVIAAGGAALFAGWVIDRLLYYGVNVMAKRKAQKFEDAARAVTSIKEKAKAQSRSEPPIMPYPKQGDLN